MYGKYFNIDESAFSIAPNPKYLYLSDQHQEALAHLLFGVTRPGGFVLLTGEIGTGKTTVCRSLFLEVPENTDIALIVNPKLNPDDLLASICDEFEISYPEYQLSSKTYINKLNEHLIKSHAEGKNTILIVDEAQNLSVEALETIRVLTNLETDEQKLLQIILIGQPELRDRLNSPEMKQLNQRITARFHLHALDKKETKEYLMHRLKVANSDPDLFSKSNIKYIYKLTGGIPRLINVLCDRALLGAFVQKQKTLSNDIIRNAAIESLGSQVKHSVSRYSWLGILFIMLSIVVVAATVFIFYNDIFIDDATLTTGEKKIERTLPKSAHQENYENHRKDEVKRHVAPNELVENEQENKKSVIESVNEPVISVSKQREAEKENTDISGNASALSMENSESDEIQSEEIEANIEEKDIDSKQLQVEVNKIEPTLLSDKETLIQKKDVPVIEEISTEEAVDLSSKTWPYRLLFSSWGLEYTDTSLAPCEFAQLHDLYCFSSEGDVALLRRLNRPVILKKYTPDQADAYLFIKRAERGEVIVVEESGEYRVRWEQIAEAWAGEFEMLWKPMSKLEYIRPGREGGFVELIDKNLSVIFNREPRWEAIPNYDATLVEEIKSFQRTQKISPDGVIGPLTQIYMNNLVNTSVPKLR